MHIYGYQENVHDQGGKDATGNRRGVMQVEKGVEEVLGCR